MFDHLPCPPDLLSNTLLCHGNGALGMRGRSKPHLGGFNDTNGRGAGGLDLASDVEKGDTE